MVEWSGARLWDGSSAWLRPLSRARRVPLSSHRGAPAQPTSRRRPQRVGTRAAFASVASRTRSQSDCVSRCSANSPRPGNGPSGTTRDEVATSGEGRRWQSPWHRTSPVRRNSLCGRTSSATREASLAGPAFGVLPDPSPREDGCAPARLFYSRSTPPSHRIGARFDVAQAQARSSCLTDGRNQDRPQPGGRSHPGQPSPFGLTAGEPSDVRWGDAGCWPPVEPIGRSVEVFGARCGRSSGVPRPE